MPFFKKDICNKIIFNHNDINKLRARLAHDYGFRIAMQHSGLIDPVLGIRQLIFKWPPY